MSIDNAIFKRKSSFNFSSENITNNEIKQIVEASKWAPSPGNNQSWRIIGVSQKSTNFPKLIKALSEGNQEWAVNSGLILVFCTNEIENEFNPKIFLEIGFSGQNAMLQSSELGLESHPIGGWDEEKVKDLLLIPNNSKVAFLLVIGRKGDEKKLSENLLSKNNKKRNRNSLEEDFNFDSWGDKF
jgi:nitroreductase